MRQERPSPKLLRTGCLIAAIALIGIVASFSTLLWIGEFDLFGVKVSAEVVSDDGGTWDVLGYGKFSRIGTVMDASGKVVARMYLVRLGTNGIETVVDWR